jgi:hypothetical protein
LIDRLKKISVLQPQPEVQIRGDGAGAVRLRSGGSSTPASARELRRSRS